MPTPSETTKAELLQELKTTKNQLKNFEILNAELHQEVAHLNSLKLHCTLRDKELEQKLEALQQAEKNLRMSQLIVDRSPVVLFRRLAGETPTLEYISENFSQFGYLPEDFIQGRRTFREIIHPEDMEMISAQIKHYAAADVEEYSLIYRILTENGEVRWVDDQTSVVRDEEGNKIHNQGILIDITERKLAEDALRKSEEKFRRIVETTAQGFVLLNKELRILEVNAAYCRIVGYAEHELLGKTPLDLAPEEFRQIMLANKQSMLEQEYREFEAIVVHKKGHHVPILVHGNTLTDDDGTIIGNMAFVTDMTEQKKALMLAKEVQKSLLPHQKPKVPGLDVAGRNVSCDEIGGDYYDFLWRREASSGPFSVVVGDISGHGVESALLMTTARAFLRMRVSQPGSTSEVISAMNTHLAKDVLESGRFMTLFYLTIDPEEKKLSWVRAGHDPAIFYDPVLDCFEELKGGGIALGVMNEFSYTENEKSGLANNQILAVGTDGIWEATNVDGEMFGKDRLRAIIREHRSAPANHILNAVYENLNEFTRGHKAEDDITLVIIKVDGVDDR